MKNLKRISKITCLALATLFLTISCSEDDTNTDMPSEDMAKVKINLVDAPGDYEKVNIDIQDVLINRSDDEEGGWESVGEVNTGVYDLLELTGGASVVLVENEILEGDIEQLRLVLGEENSVVVDGEEYPLDTPSAQQSGLKIKFDDVELEGGFTYEITLDFDAEKSVVDAGNSGKYILKPVINASTEVNSGKIRGAVTPNDYQVLAWVVADQDTITTYTNDEGIYVLSGVPAGTYDVMLTPDEASGLANATIADVVVENGAVTDAGTVELMAISGGNITGTVVNADVVVTASIMVGEEMVSADINEEGMFTLENIPAGTYILTLTPGEGSAFGIKEVADVEVVEGEITALGDITLE
ncbi:DUF4382 domain-containing protein [Galbibacter mesophilus]|uniref:DUF4382 domain-containing protein n=1 Tax=Galbibacter mesophilus TaxID=379069 RepID=UPI00191E9782|nr:DUF4382 domain-containing protein [Galbibacter mesophilus]MCM5662093.1 DUF4382 domain-containing protein [Galbibacter mesophilus]